MFLFLTVLALILYDAKTPRYRTWKIVTSVVLIYLFLGLGALAGLLLTGEVVLLTSP